jgi:hypothetical protein
MEELTRLRPLSSKAAQYEAALQAEAAASVRLYDSTFSRIVWGLYGGAKGLVVWY